VERLQIHMYCSCLTVGCRLTLFFFQCAESRVFRPFGTLCSSSKCFSSLSSCLSFFLGPVEVANKFGMGTGAVHNCSTVFNEALNKLVGTYISWPSAERRDDLAECIWETFGFRGCVGSTDGTTIPLAYALRIQPWTYWYRHDRYSISPLLACDHERNIISATPGFPGAARNAYVQRHADWCRYLGQHIFPLSIFWVTRTCATLLESFVPTKRLLGTSDEKSFNFQLSSLRLVYERVTGMLKGLWMSLRELRVSTWSG